MTDRQLYAFGTAAAVASIVLWTYIGFNLLL